MRAFADANTAFLEVVESMEHALRVASSSKQPLPPDQPAGSAAAASSSSLGGGGPAAAAVVVVDTVAQRREEAERSMRQQLAGCDARVQDAFAQLHRILGEFSDFCLDEAQSRQAFAGMVSETAALEERIVGLYASLASDEAKLMQRLL